jgi:hypothetical protein
VTDDPTDADVTDVLALAPPPSSSVRKPSVSICE